MKTQSYNNFWQRIHKVAKNKGFPLRVTFELTYRCNFYCRHCYVPHNYRKKGELKTKKVFSLLNQLKDIGCFYLGFTGGEPFIREDIIDILRYAKKLGFEIIIYTNGSLINEEIADELARLRPNKVDITIPAMSKENFERVTQLPGSHQKVFSAIDLLYKKGVELGFKTCVLKENEDEIKGIQDFANSLGALHRLADVLSPRLDGSREPFKYQGVLIENSDVSDTPHATGFALQESDVKNQSPINQLTNHQELFKCGVGVSQVAITPQGELKMCLMIDYPKYKILTNSRFSVSGNRLSLLTAHRTPQTKNRNHGADLKMAWQKLKELVSSIKPDENYQCDRCELEPYCKWCPARGWLYNRTFTWCEPESRAFAENRRERM